MSSPIEPLSLPPTGIYTSFDALLEAAQAHIISIILFLPCTPLLLLAVPSAKFAVKLHRVANAFLPGLQGGGSSPYP